MPLGKNQPVTQNPAVAANKAASIINAQTKGVSKMSAKKVLATQNLQAASAALALKSKTKDATLGAAKTEVSASLLALLNKHLGETAQNQLGHKGGKAKHGVGIGGDREGYELRSFLKGKSRTFMKSKIEATETKLKTDKKDEITNTPGLSDEEKKAKIEEFEDKRAVQDVMARKALYNKAKLDVVSKLDSESAGVVSEILNMEQSSIDNSVADTVSSEYDNAFKSSYIDYKIQGKANLDDEAEKSALDSVLTNKEDIAKKVYEKLKDNITESTKAKAAEKRKQIITKVGGKFDTTGKKPVASFSDVKTDDVKAAKDYVYEGKEKDLDDSITQTVTTGVSNEKNVNSGLNTFTKAICFPLRKNGDLLSLTGGFKIPVYPGVYVEFNLAGEVELEDGIYRSKLSANIGAGGTVGAANLGGTISVYNEFEAKSPEDMAKLMSYLYYRTCRESAIFPSSLVGDMWGMGGATGKTKGEEATAKGAAMESELFGAPDTPNKARMGMGLDFNASLGFGSKVQGDSPGGASFNIGGGFGKEYSRNAFEKKGTEAKIGSTKEEHRWSGIKSKAMSIGEIHASAGVSGFGLFGGTADFQAKFSGADGSFDSIKIGLEGYIKSSDAATGKIAQVVGASIMGAADALATAGKIGRIVGQKMHDKTANSKVKSEAADAVFSATVKSMVDTIGIAGLSKAADSGSAAGWSTDALSAAAGAGNEGMKAFDTLSESMVNVRAELEWQSGSHRPRVRISLNNKKTLGIRMDIVTLAAMKKERLFGFDSEKIKDPSTFKGMSVT